MSNRDWDKMWDEQIARKHADWENWMFDGKKSPHQPAKHQKEQYQAPRKIAFSDAPAIKKPSILDAIKRVRDMNNNDNTTKDK